MKKNRYYRRFFLNSEEDGGMAAIAVKLDVESNYTSVSVAISDCNRTVDLEFSSWDRAERLAARRKLALLIDTLSDFQEVMLAEFARCDRHPDKE